MEVIGNITPPEKRTNILSADHEVLRKSSRPVENFNHSISELVEKMANTMYYHRGVGLAAVQVGVPKQVIVMDWGEGLKELINPKIISQNGSEEGFEGCLSLPGFMGEVHRPTEVRIQAYDRKGKKIWLDAEGWSARAVCHEIDHLHGELFVDKSDRLLKMPPETNLRIIFMGTPDFAVPTLEKMQEENCELVGVVTAPDRRRGRGQKQRPSPVKEVALEHRIPILQPEPEDDEEFITHLKWLEPDLIVTNAYGRILKSEILQIPKIGCINVHPSLLPRYRGAAPLQRPLLNDEKQSGITIFWMDEGTDSGPILLQREMPIEQMDTAGDLHDRLSEAAAEVLMEALSQIADGNAQRRKQNDKKATYAPKIKKEEVEINWSQPAEQVVNQIRAFSPQPGAWTQWQGNRIKIFQARLKCGTDINSFIPGEVVCVKPEGIDVATEKGLCQLIEVQPSGKKKMNVADFVNGYEIQAGDVLGT